MERAKLQKEGPNPTSPKEGPNLEKANPREGRKGQPLRRKGQQSKPEMKGQIQRREGQNSEKEGSSPLTFSDVKKFRVLKLSSMFVT